MAEQRRATEERRRRGRGRRGRQRGGGAVRGHIVVGGGGGGGAAERYCAAGVGHCRCITDGGALFDAGRDRCQTIEHGVGEGGAARRRRRRRRRNVQRLVVRTVAAWGLNRDSRLLGVAGGEERLYLSGSVRLETRATESSGWLAGWGGGFAGFSFGAKQRVFFVVVISIMFIIVNYQGTIYSKKLSDN